jgi:hypothetical protein
VGITTTRVETFVAPTMDVVRRGILIGSTTKLDSGSNGVLVGRKLNGSTTLPIVVIGVVGTPWMVFTNSIMITLVNRIVDRPSTSSMATKGNRSVDAMNSKGRYRKPFVVTTPILDHRGGHYVRPNRVAFKYFNFKKDDNPDAHVVVFNFVVK